MINLRILRKERGLKLKQLGEIIGVAESTVSLYEQGKREPDNATLKKLADYFEVSVDYLLGREENKTVEKKSDKNKIEIIARGGETFTYTVSDEDLQTAKNILEMIKKAQGIPTNDNKEK